MAHRDSWPGILRHGLLSTSALLSLFEIEGSRRSGIEGAHRPESVVITHPQLGVAVIRDQKPMSDSGLRRALPANISTAEWYRTLNDKVFFWLTEERFATLRNARAYRNSEHLLITVDTGALLAEYLEHVLLCPINSGCTKPFPHPRDHSVFLPLSKYPFDEWVTKRSGRDPVVELAVTGGVANVSGVTRSVEVVSAGARSRIWP